jgi:hypothetical protein
MTHEGYCIENTGRIVSIQQTASYVNQPEKKGNPEWLLNKGEGVIPPPQVMTREQMGPIHNPVLP